MRNTLEQQAMSDAHQFTIIADDMTGACDAAVPFAQCGFRTVVMSGGRIPNRTAADVVAISTETRDATSALLLEALQRQLHLLSQTNWSGKIFKKVDSALRGNSVAEIVEFSRLFPAKILAVAPAYPALERTMKAGVQLIGSGPNLHSIDLHTALCREGLTLRSLNRGLVSTVMSNEIAAAISAGVRVLLFDAEMQRDLDAVAEALLPLRDQICWVGSGGLAHALAQATSRQHEVLPDRSARGRIIFVIGSDHDVTQGQLRHLREGHRVAEATPTDARPQEDLVVCMVQRGASPETTASYFSEADPMDIGCIFVTGGDTASHLCRALCVDAIEIRREFASGVPVGILRGGPMDGVCVITKSGGFGETNLLSRIVADYSHGAGGQLAHS